MCRITVCLIEMAFTWINMALSNGEVINDEEIQPISAYPFWVLLMSASGLPMTVLTLTKTFSVLLLTAYLSMIRLSITT